MNDPGLPLPPAVLARLQTAESLRAEMAGIVAERDALREELQTAGWERDTAQCEAAYLREEVLLRDRPWSTDDNPRIGRLLTMGDEPPPAPESGADIALVSLSTGEVYVRGYPNSDSPWSKYGEYTSSTDFVTLAERGPWVTVDGWRYQDHKERSEAHRRLYAAVHCGIPGTGNYVYGWPESTERFRESIDGLSAQRFPNIDNPNTSAAWIEAWRNLAQATRAAWEVEHKHNERLQSFLRFTPHEAEWERKPAPGRVCTLCGASEADHISDGSQETAVTGASSDA